MYTTQVRSVRALHRVLLAIVEAAAFGAASPQVAGPATG